MVSYRVSSVGQVTENGGAEERGAWRGLGVLELPNWVIRAGELCSEWPRNKQVSVNVTATALLQSTRHAGGEEAELMMGWDVTARAVRPNSQLVNLHRS